MHAARIRGTAGPPQRTASAMTRGAIVLGAAIFALVAAASGLDRASMAERSLARLVPAPFAAQAWLAKTRRAIEAGDYDAASELARRAVRAAPVEPDATALLGAARLGSGDAAAADRAFLVAGQLGWRAPLTQVYWMQQAAAVGDYRVAAMRADALFRQNPALVSSALVAPFERDEAARAAFIGLLAAQPNWLETYLRNFEGVAASSILVRGELTDALAAHTGPLGCRAVGALVAQLIDAGAILEADRLWRRHCPEQAGSLIGDGAFRTLAVHQPNSPFDWAVTGDSDVSLSLADGPRAGERQVVLVSSATFPRRVLARLVPLPPGQYRISWKATGADGRDSDRIVVALSCRADGADWAQASFDPVTRRAFATFAVDGACAARWLGLGVRPGSDEVRLGEVAIDPA